MCSSDQAPVTRNVANRRVRAHLLYRKHVEAARRVLDLGCKQAIDARLIRKVNERAEIHAADFWDFADLPAFAAEDIRYRRLTHPWHTEYADDYFDAVVLSGVLEHVPNDAETLKELFRIVRNGGKVILTFLPNRLSWTEFLARNVLYRRLDGGTMFHNRLYSLSEILTILKRSGFLPVEWGYHQFLPSLVDGYRFIRMKRLREVAAAMFRIDPLFERLWPLRMFCANVYVIAEKKKYM